MASANLRIQPDQVIGRVNPRLFGSFIEHLGRAVYNGIYEPGHPSADADGFRSDVINLVKQLGVTTIRYPGGNFVSGFRWEDSVGPRERRPRRIDLAWHSTETNEVGLHEFAGWLEKVDAELMLAVNLGTRGIAEAVDLLEYANLTNGTSLSDQRIANGRREPFGVRMWCLGNEMDGPWQLGNRTAEDYADLAARTAHAMKLLDPTLELVACGSSSSSMPTFGQWERTVIGRAFDHIDHISCHAYYENRGDLASFLASGVDMDRFIRTVADIADEASTARGSQRRITISFDEWNIWYNSRFEEEEKLTDPRYWPVAPRLLEDSYSVSDAVAFGGLLITLLKHVDRVASASLAQLVNVIAPIMTEPGGPAWRQTTFFPFAEASRHARGLTVAAEMDCPLHHTAEFGDVPILDGVAVTGNDGSLLVQLVNRSVDEPVELTVHAAGFDPARFRVEGRILHDNDPEAANTLSDPLRVGLQELPTTWGDAGVRVSLPPVSWSQLRLVPTAR